MADINSIIARLQNEDTPFNRISRQGLVGAVERGNLSPEQADKLITDAQQEAAGTAAPQTPPNISSNDLSLIDRGRPLSAEEAATPPSTAADALAQLDAGDQKTAVITFSDGRKARITGTVDEINAKVDEVEGEIQTGAQDLAARQQKIQDLEQEATIREQRGEDVDPLSVHILKTLQGETAALGEAGLTLASGAVAAPVAGIAGLLEIIGGQDPLEAANTVRDVQDALTFTPRTQRGKETLETIAVPFQKLEEGADHVAASASGGNPFAATAIKTGLLGVLDVVGGAKGIRARRSSLKALENVQKMADDSGVRLQNSNMRSDIIERVAEMTPEERAANAPALQQALRDARDTAKGQVDDAFKTARQKRAFVDTQDTARLSRQMRDNLIDEGFDLETMPDVQRRLAELENLGTDRPGVGPRGTPVLTAQLRQFEIIRQRANRAFSKNPDRAAQNSALTAIKRGMDDFLDGQFNRDAVSGDKAAVQAWKDARGAHRQYRENFSADKAIKQLVEQDATPEQMRAWLTGASALNAKPQAAATMGRLRQILGDDHPAINGIKQDLLFEVAQPLYKEVPDFKKFIANYDNLIAKNPALIKEMGMQIEALKPLRELAATAERVGTDIPFWQRDTTLRAFSQFVAGNKLAKATLRQNFLRRTVNFILGGNSVSKKKIIFDLAQAQSGGPVIARNGPIAGSLIANSELARAGIEEDEK